MPEGGFSFSHKKGQTFVPYNGKIADITHADTNKHTLTLANAAGTGAIAGETREIIAVILTVTRVSGTGGFLAYPNEGTSSGGVGSSSFVYPAFVVVADGLQRLQYKLDVANDDFDLYCVGFVVEA